MIRGILAAGVAALLLAGAYWVALDAASRARSAAGAGESAAGYREPEIRNNFV